MQQEAVQVGVHLLPAAKTGKPTLVKEVQLAILSRVDFDATEIDPATITFAGAIVSPDAAGKLKARLTDVDGDGLTDMVVTFALGSLQVGSQPTKVNFSAQTKDGRLIEGGECAQASGEPCGAPINTTQQHHIIQAFTPNAATATFSYTGPVVPIPDSNATGVNITLNVTGVVGTIADLNFSFDGATCTATAGATTVGVDHSWVGDLVVKLTSPASTTVVLMNRPGGGTFGSSGNNFCQTVLDDSGSSSIQAIASTGAPPNGPPYTGTFTPANPLSAFNGQNPNGNWVLNVSDNAAGDTGNVRAFSLIITPQAACTITCPANITQPNDANQCGAVVNYSAPTTGGGGCGTVTCSPASGSFFPKGTTTVNCSTTAGPSCSFTVTVNDTQPPTITCPANQSAVTSTGGASSTVVNYPPPTASDNCPGVMVACVPASGTSFPRGTTTVTCTATDSTGNTASCSFSVQVFNGRLQDDSEGCNNTVLFDTVTGDYRWCCHGTTFTGKAKVQQQGSTFTLSQLAVDRRVLILLNAASGPPNGSASLQVPPSTMRCTITDRDITNDTCFCGNMVVGTSPQR